MNLTNGEIIERQECVLNEIVSSWEDDYFISYRR
jgi:hypothetical protein